MQVLRVKVVIFHCVGRLENNGILKALDMSHCLQLNLKGKG